MAQPKIIRGTYFVLGAGDGGSPETFTGLCGLSAKSLVHAHNTSDSFTRDCADPENVPVRNLIVTGEQWSLSANGDIDRSNLDTIIALDDGQTHNWRLWFTEPAGDLVFQGYWQGPAIMTNLTISPSDTAFAPISLNLESDGAWTFTAT